MVWYPGCRLYPIKVFFGGQYVWRVQLPFVVSYQSAEVIKDKDFMVTLNIVKVPTSVTPDGIGVNQFLMKAM